MNILKLAAMLTLDGSRFKAGIKEAEVAANRFGKDTLGALKGEFAAAFSGGALVYFVKNALESVGALQDMAEQAHMTTDQVQRTSAAAEDMGMSFQDVANAERQFNQHRKEAIETNEELRDTFSRYGVTLDDLQNPQFKFFDFLQKANVAMNAMDEDQMTAGLNDMADILGNRVGPRLQEFIKNLDKVKDRPIVDAKTVKDIDEAGDSLHAMMTQAKGLAALAAVHPMQFSEAMVERQFQMIPTWLQKFLLPGRFSMNAGTMPDPQISQDYDEPIGPQLQNRKVGRDLIAEKKQSAFDKAQEALQQASMMFGLTKQQQLEAQLREGMDFINYAESEAGGPSAASLGARKDALGILSQLAGMQSGKLDVASMTKVGALAGGRGAFVNAGENELVRQAKELLGVNKTSNDLLVQIRDKKGMIVNASR